MANRDRLIELVRRGGRLDSGREAEGITRTVMAALADNFPGTAWEMVAETVPDDLHGDAHRRREGPASVNAVFEEVGDALGLGTATAARYVRVVTEAISRQMTEEQRDRLGHHLEDEYLALFEVGHRGELTEEDGTTPGAEVVGGEDDAQPNA